MIGVMKKLAVRGGVDIHRHLDDVNYFLLLFYPCNFCLMTIVLHLISNDLLLLPKLVLSGYFFPIWKTCIQHFFSNCVCSWHAENVGGLKVSKAGITWVVFWSKIICRYLDWNSQHFGTKYSREVTRFRFAGTLKLCWHAWVDETSSHHFHSPGKLFYF